MKKLKKFGLIQKITLAYITEMQPTDHDIAISQIYCDI